MHFNRTKKTSHRYDVRSFLDFALFVAAGKASNPFQGGEALFVEHIVAGAIVIHGGRNFGVAEVLGNIRNRGARRDGNRCEGVAKHVRACLFRFATGILEDGSQTTRQVAAVEVFAVFGDKNQVVRVIHRLVFLGDSFQTRHRFAVENNRADTGLGFR